MWGWQGLLHLWVLAPGEGEERWRQRDLCCGRRSGERRETAKVRGSAAQIQNESAGALEGEAGLGRDGKRRRGSGRWSRVREQGRAARDGNVPSQNDRSGMRGAASGSPSPRREDSGSRKGRELGGL